MRHPWQLTWKEFLETVRHYYGVDIRGLRMGSRGLLLRREDRIYSLPHLREDEILPASFLRSACRILGIPPEDFGLDPEEDD